MDKQLLEQEIKEAVRLIAWDAWKGAANAYRLYPDNNHTFTDYWTGAESLFENHRKSLETIAGATSSSTVKELEREVERLKKELELSEIEVQKLTWQLNEKR